MSSKKLDIKLSKEVAMWSKWDQRFISLAKLIASWSKDESTQVGAVIVDNKKRIVSLGYNGFPSNVKDEPERYKNRELKLSMIIHAEINAIMFAQKSINNCVLYCYPLPPCSQCASMIIQAGIRRVVSIKPSEELEKRWGESLKLSHVLFEEVGVEWIEYDFT